MIDLVRDFVLAKQAEKDATDRRVAAGNKLAEALGHREENQRTFEIENYKVRVKAVFNRKVDWSAFDDLHLVTPPQKIKRELDMTGLRWHEQNRPEEYKKILSTITTTPGRTQIEVEEKDHV
jgi:hypothetical protein